MLSLNVGLWIAQGLLAAGFGMAGVMKSFRPIAFLTEKMGWPGDYSNFMVRFIGIVEGAGAIAMVLPMVTGILPWLTPLAAIGFAVIQVLAIRVHAQRNELAKSLAMNLILMGMSLFVVWGRWDLFVGI